MTVQRIDFVGIRTNRLGETAALFRDILKAPVARQAKDLVGFKLADETVLELYGPSDTLHAFFTTGPVVAFRVEDFEAARKAMLKAGVGFIGNVQHAGRHYWQHFHSPDGAILELSGPAAHTGG